MPPGPPRKRSESITTETIKVGLLAGLTQRQIAERGGVSKRWVEGRIAAARKQLGAGWPFADEIKRQAMLAPVPDPKRARHTGEVTHEVARKIALATLTEVAEDEAARGADRVAAAAALMRAFPDKPAEAPQLDAVDLLQEIDRATLDVDPG